jgi:hypothetical protein
LEQLKVYSRDPVGNDEMYTASGIEVLGQHGFIVNTEDRHSAREAQRVLANALLMAPKTRQFVVDCGFHEKAAEGFKVSLPPGWMGGCGVRGGGADCERDRTPMSMTSSCWPGYCY